MKLIPSGFTVVDITKHYPKSFKLLIKLEAIHILIIEI
jgi:hypothetical protein